MFELVHLSWRAYPAALLIAAGLAAAVWSARRGVARARRLRDPGRALAVMQGFRRAIVGLAVAAVGAAWWWHIGWLFGLALVIGGQELLESTVVIAALKHGPDVPRRAPAPCSGGRRSVGVGVARGWAYGPHRAAASQRAMVASRSGGSGTA